MLHRIAIVLNYIFFIWIIYVLDMFWVLWRQLRWKWKKSVFLFSSSIQRSQNFLFNVLGLWTWKGKRKVLKSQLLIELLTKSSKNRSVSGLKMMKIKCKEKKTCKNVCGGELCKCKSALLSPFGFGTLNLPAENPELVLLKRSALKPLKLICSLGECRKSRKKNPLQCSCTSLQSSFSYGRYVWLYLGRMQYCAFMI